MPRDPYAELTVTEAKKEWKSVTATLTSELQRAIRDKNDNMTRAQKSADELRDLWYHFRDFSRPDDTEIFGKWEHVINTFIERLSETIASDKKQGTRSTMSRCLRAMTSFARLIPEQCYERIIDAVQQLTELVDDSAERWSYHERNQQVRKEQIERGLRPANETEPDKQERLPRKEHIDYQQLIRDIENVARQTVTQGQTALDLEQM
jgi:hypothetical protein